MLYGGFVGIEEDIKTGKFFGLGALQALVKKRKADEKNIRQIVKDRQRNLEFKDPKANIMTLAKGIRLIAKEHPESAQLLNAIILLTQKFTRTHEQALEIIAKESRKPVQFVRDRELEAVKRVMDAIESSLILQLA